MARPAHLCVPVGPAPPPMDNPTLRPNPKKAGGAPPRFFAPHGDPSFFPFPRPSTSIPYH